MSIMHIDMNSYFASVEQQANPRLRGKPIGVTGGDREVRTVLCTASVEAKKLGVKTGMQIWEAKKICPNLILVPGDSAKYLYCTTKFLNIFKDYTPFLEVFSIDECFLGIAESGNQKIVIARNEVTKRSLKGDCFSRRNVGIAMTDKEIKMAMNVAIEIKQRLKAELGERITCSIGISYNKLLAKLAGSLKKPDGLVVIPDEDSAIKALDQCELDDICGIGPRIKNRLFKMGIRDFKTLRQVPKEALLASFKSYGAILYNMARGIDHTPIKPFYEKEEVKSIGHRHTIDHDTSNSEEIWQIILKMSEMVAFRLRDKKLVGKTVHIWYRAALVHLPGVNNSPSEQLEGVFYGEGMQLTLGHYIQDGLEMAHSAQEIFTQIWDREKIRMVGVAISNLKPARPVNLSLLPEEQRQKAILQTLDKVNHKFGDFTLMRGTLLNYDQVKRNPNPKTS